MNLKTLTGSSIHAALQEARSLFGDHVVLLESAAPRDGQPARITVMADGAALDTAATPRRAAPTPARVPALAEDAAGRRTENVSTRAGARIDWSTDDEVPSGRPSVPALGPAARGTLYPSRSAALAPAAPAAPAPPALTASDIEHLLAAPLQALQARLDAMERRFGAAIIGAAHAFAAHPLFAALLAQGMRPQTATDAVRRARAERLRPGQRRGFAALGAGAGDAPPPRRHGSAPVGGHAAVYRAERGGQNVAPHQARPAHRLLRSPKARASS